MPRIKSAKKRMRQAKTHATLNRTQRSQLRTAIKKVRGRRRRRGRRAAYDEAVQAARSRRPEAAHPPNAAARQKSRLAKLVKGGAKK